MNIRSEPVTLYKGLKIATIELIEVECSNNRAVQTVSNECRAGISASKGELLSKMAMDAGVYLSEDERQKFFDLVCIYADIFAGSTADLGRTSKLKSLHRHRNSTTNSSIGSSIRCLDRNGSPRWTWLLASGNGQDR